MELLFILIGILFIIIFILSAKIYFLHKSIQEIGKAFEERLNTDTNTLIDISSSNVHLRKLAAKINEQLRLLRTERHRYQQGDLELKEAVTNISHDLRTPLTAISGYLDLLEKEEKSNTVKRYVSQIKNRTDVLKNLIDELFRYSIVTSVQELKPKRIDAVCVLEESLLSFYAIMQEKKIQPNINLPETTVWCKLDADALGRIFSNIIGNALKYSEGDFAVIMDEHGSISFSNTATQFDSVAVSRLFDRFYTIESNRNSTGLGLSIAKMLCERMNCDISASYENNKLYIYVHLPLNQ